MQTSSLSMRSLWPSAGILKTSTAFLGLGLLCACGGITGSSTTSAPVISSFQPTALTVNNVVVVTGSGFTNTTSVTIGGATVNSFAASSDSSLSVLVPAAAITGPIIVTTTAGTVTSASSFIVIPQITSFTPASGPVATVVTLTGSGFSGATSVTFGSETSSLNAPVVVGPNEIIATLDANGTTGPIQVLASGVTATSADPFTVTAQ
jgi:hypothetical protein